MFSVQFDEEQTNRRRTKEVCVLELEKYSTGEGRDKTALKSSLKSQVPSGSHRRWYSALGLSLLDMCCSRVIVVVVVVVSSIIRFVPAGAPEQRHTESGNGHTPVRLCVRDGCTCGSHSGG